MYYHKATKKEIKDDFLKDSNQAFREFINSYNHTFKHYKIFDSDVAFEASVACSFEYAYSILKGIGELLEKQLSTSKFSDELGQSLNGKISESEKKIREILPIIQFYGFMFQKKTKRSKKI